MNTLDFWAVEIGQKFKYKGSEWVKKSSRTAKPLFDCNFSYSHFNKNELVTLVNDDNNVFKKDTLEAINKALMLIDRDVVNADFKNRISITSSDIAKQLLTISLATETREHFEVLFLDNQHCLIKHERLFSGTIDGAAIYPRVILQKALEYNANALIIAHNHPSGIPDPSTADRMITDRIRNACSVVDIRLLDHFIVAGHNVLSFSERGLL